jgi:hypothetical protein
MGKDQQTQSNQWKRKQEIMDAKKGIVPEPVVSVEKNIQEPEEVSEVTEDSQVGEDTVEVDTEPVVEEPVKKKKWKRKKKLDVLSADKQKESSTDQVSD